MSGTSTPTIDLPTSKVRVIKPNPETGEIIERVIPVTDLRPKLPSPPKVDQRRITRVVRSTAHGPVEAPTGSSIVYLIDHREREIEYWKAHRVTLTRQERRLLSRGEGTSALRPIRPDWQTGDRFYLATDMEAEVLEVTESVRGYGTVFKVHDHRLRYLKRGVIGSDVPKTDEHGYAPALTQEEEARAQVESAYTTVPSKAIDDAGAVMDEDAYQRIHGEQSAGNAVAQSKGRVRVSEARLFKRLAEAQEKNRASTVRHLERQLESLWRKKGKIPMKETAA
jgi:hypothetical protein